MVQVNTEENARLAGRYQVRSIPMLAVIRRGQILDTMSGARPAAAIASWFRDVVRRAGKS